MPHAAHRGSRTASRVCRAWPRRPSPLRLAKRTPLRLRLQSRRRCRGRSDWRRMAPPAIRILRRLLLRAVRRLRHGDYAWATAITGRITALAMVWPRLLRSAITAIGFSRFHGNGPWFASGNFGHFRRQFGGGHVGGFAGGISAIWAASAAGIWAALAAATLAAAEAGTSANTRLASPSASGGPSGRPILFGRTAGSKATPS